MSMKSVNPTTGQVPREYPVLSAAELQSRLRLATTGQPKFGREPVRGYSPLERSHRGRTSTTSRARSRLPPRRGAIRLSIWTRAGLSPAEHTHQETKRR